MENSVGVSANPILLSISEKQTSDFARGLHGRLLLAIHNEDLTCDYYEVIDLLLEQYDSDMSSLIAHNGGENCMQKAAADKDCSTLALRICGRQTSRRIRT